MPPCSVPTAWHGRTTWPTDTTSQRFVLRESQAGRDGVPTYATAVRMAQCYRLRPNPQRTHPPTPPVIRPRLEITPPPSRWWFPRSVATGHESSTTLPSRSLSAIPRRSFTAREPPGQARRRYLRWGSFCSIARYSGDCTLACHSANDSVRSCRFASKVIALRTSWGCNRR